MKDYLLISNTKENKISDFYLNLVSSYIEDSTNKKVPLLNYNQRKKILSSLSGVDKIVPQNDWCYSSNILKYKPDIMVHGDDWKEGVQKNVRENVIKTLSEWGGELVEPKYTEGVSSTNLIDAVRERGITPDNRLKSLRRLLNLKPLNKKQLEKSI